MKVLLAWNFLSFDLDTWQQTKYHPSTDIIEMIISLRIPVISVGDHMKIGHLKT